MKKKLYHLDVVTNDDGLIILGQEDGSGDGGATIWLSVDQVDIVIGLLKEAKEEISRLPGEVANAFADAARPPLK